MIFTYNKHVKFVFDVLKYSKLIDISIIVNAQTMGVCASKFEYDNKMKCTDLEKRQKHLTKRWIKLNRNESWLKTQLADAIQERDQIERLYETYQKAIALIAKETKESSNNDMNATNITKADAGDN